MSNHPPKLQKTVFDALQINTFKLEDLFDRVLSVNAFQSDDGKIVNAVDMRTGEIFVLKCVPKAMEDID